MRCLKNPERVEYRSGFAISVQGYAERRFRCQVSAPDEIAIVIRPEGEIEKATIAATNQEL